MNTASATSQGPPQARQTVQLVTLMPPSRLSPDGGERSLLFVRPPRLPGLQTPYRGGHELNVLETIGEIVFFL